ncbi:unnamed protein product [Albugo candida]|uniref:Uncharacterized protein n=1 Tax=Albugo candida TaxID=65357 RepID=A0A024FTR4_9STRA|nr:unnamed protein product [Albugo candida]|eukprot:CCI10049.1 unnamed protein product [Albugo candida]
MEHTYFETSDVRFQNWWLLDELMHAIDEIRCLIRVDCFLSDGWRGRRLPPDTSAEMESGLLHSSSPAKRIWHRDKSHYNHTCAVYLTNRRFFISSA